MRLRPAAALVLTSVLVIGLAPADAKIVQGKSISGVQIGQTRAQVEQLLGPSAELAVGDEESDYSVDYPVRRLTVFYLTADAAAGPAETDKVFSVGTYSPNQRTASGVRVGMKQSAMRKALKGEKCSVAEFTFINGQGSRTARECNVTSKTTGYVTSYYIAASTHRVFYIELSDPTPGS